MRLLLRYLYISTALTTGFLDPLSPHTSPGGARIKLGHTGTHYDEVVALLEGFARPLWGLASLLSSGDTYAGTERWVRGLASGTDPSAEGEYWGQTRDRDQRMVEMSPIGFALAMAREELWERLGGGGKEEDWLWFRIFRNLGLGKVGVPHDRERMLKDLDHLDRFYLCDGWSRDSPEGFAQLLYAKLAGDEDPVRAKEYKEGAARFAVDFVHYFDEDEDMSTLLPPYLSNPGVIKGLLRNLRWWSTHHKATFNSDAFLVLAISSEHSFWTSEELPHPFSIASTPLPVVYPIKHPLHIVACHYPLKATQAKYGKFSYSAAFGFCTPTGGFMLDQHALDGMIGIEMAGTWDVFGDREIKCETWLVPPPPTAAGVETEEHWHLRDGKLLSAEASWAVYGQGSDARLLNLTSTSTPSNQDSLEGRGLPDVTGGAAYAVSAGGAVGIKDLLPTSTGKRATEALAVDANASLIWPRTVLPTLRRELGEGERKFVTVFLALHNYEGKVCL
ncbi:hypothetical protein EV426DRAFT_632574 [Tirmania nivea]|nr:hypothetical protein EV426DRAFT_632574 [Tirmania nivea]